MRGLAPRLSRYQVLGRLATGGMAEVWLARTQGIAGFEKLVVVKTILPELARVPEFVTMFVNEARLAAMLSHPNCVQIFDLGEEDGVIYIAMEYLEGFSLSRLFSRAKRQGVHVSDELVARIIMDAASGLDYAHRLKDREGHPVNLVHRDVSPDNLLVGFSGQVKVVDFGIAKAATPALVPTTTTVGTVKGKHGYIAPEYLLGLPIDARADLFGLGVVLYRALTGKRPFDGDTEALVSMSVLQAEPRPPVELVPTVGPALSSVAMMALKKDPAARFESARAMRQALEAAVIRPADNDEVAELMNTLWPDGDAERIALHTLASGKAEERSDPVLSAISSTYGAVITATPHHPALDEQVPASSPALTPLPVVMGEPLSNPLARSPVAPPPSAFEPPRAEDEPALELAPRPQPEPQFERLEDEYDAPPSRRGWWLGLLLLLVVGGGLAAWRFQPKHPSFGAVGTGHVSVVVTGEVQVLEGDKDYGKAPVELDLGPGPHSLRFVNKARGVDVSQDLVIEPGQLTVISELPKAKKR